MKLPCKKLSKSASSGIGLIDVYVATAGLKPPLTYCCPQPLPCVGARVQVPLRSRVVWGVVCGHAAASDLPAAKIKSVVRVPNEPALITPQQMQLCRFVAQYYHVALGQVLKLCLPPATGQQTAARQRYWITALPQAEAIPKRCKLLQRIDEAIRVCPQGICSSELQRQFARSAHHVQRLAALGRVSLTQQVALPDWHHRSNNAAAKQQPICLNQQQQQAVRAILANQQQRAFLLEGVTGSGKTQVYIHVAKALLAQGKSILIVAPEIALTPMLTARFAQALQQDVLPLHSGLTAAQRRDVLLALRQEQPRVVVGARCALFAPLHNLGLIVLDEEHDSSFKQEGAVAYHARNVALWRGKNDHAVVLLGSATPSLESLHNVAQGKLKHLRLTQRVGAAGKLPQVHVIDLRARWQHAPTRKQDQALTAGQSLCVLSQPLQDAMAQALLQQQQVMLLLNRRGYSAFALCSSCGNVLGCPHCAVSLTFHKKAHALRCHQCDHSCPMPSVCPHCSQQKVLTLGLGVERVQEEVQLRFPQARIARLDRDTAHSTRLLQQILHNMQQRKTDILIGTQMIAKGHDFPQVAVVGVILADTGLCMPDFRASEQSFQLLTQVAGRAGRGASQGQVFVQTFNPHHPAIRCAQQHDSSGFAHTEMQLRQRHCQPPFSRSALVRIQGKQEQSVRQAARTVCSWLQAAVAQHNMQRSTQLLGPAPAPINLLRGHFRYHIYLRTMQVHTRAQLLHCLQQDAALQQQLRRQHCSLRIDVDPLFFL
ncbi:MAG: primosomal protein N' [Myxococcota bacterium]